MSIVSESIRVLHVDDEPDFADMAATFIEREDDRITAETATDIQEGLAYLAEDDIDCVVPDYEMPGRNGIEFLETVREEHPELPFILYTGKGSEEVASDAISAGVTDYLQKETGTSQYEVLANRISNVVEQYRARQATEETERKLSRLAEKTDDVLFMFSGDWSELLFVNSAYEDIWGVSVPTIEANPESFLEYVHPEDRERVVESMERISNGERDETEYRVVRPDGQQRWVRAQSKPIFDDDGTVSRVVGFLRDITEYKEHKRTLRRERDRFRAVFERSFDAMVIANDDGEYVEVNDSATELFGLSEEELLGRSIDEFAPDDFDFERAWRAFQASGAERGTFPLIGADGTERLVEYAATTDVVPGQHLSVLRDVTEEKERQRELREERGFVEQTLNTLDDIFYVLDRDGTLRRWNDRLLEVTGYTDEEIAEMRAVEFFAEDDRERVAEAIEEALTTGQAIVEAHLSTVDDERIPYELTGARLTDLEGDVIGLVGIARDISERKERERRIETLHETARVLMEADSDERVAELAVEAARDVLDLPLCSIHLADRRGTRLTPAAYTDPLTEIVGDPPPAMTPGGGLAWETFETGETQWYDDVSEASGRLNPDSDVGSEIILPLGEHGVFLVSAPEPGAFDEMTVCFGEILATHAETALDRLGHERRLERQNEQLDEFASVVSHDLRNPLNVAAGRLELAREECDSAHLDDVARSHERMKALIDDLLTLAHEGKRTNEMEAVDLVDLIESCWRNVATGDATIRIDIERTIQADRSRLAQLVENLLRNAVEHGGEDVSVTVGALDAGFYVEDDGPGVPATKREEVFESGYSTVEGGTGFGLSIVEEIAEAHGWEVRVTDGDEGGARFEITGIEIVE